MTIEQLCIIFVLGRQYRWLMRPEVQLGNQITAVGRVMSGVDLRDTDLPVPPVDAGTVEDSENVVDDVVPPLAAPKRKKLTAEELVAWGIQPIADARDYVRAHRKRLGRGIEAQVRTSEIWQSFGEEIRGLGALSMGLIIAEAGDIGGYSSPAKLWRRFGLAVGEDGRAQRRIANDAAAAIRSGYSPRRRATMHLVGENLLRSQGAAGPYKLLYDQRKQYEFDREPSMRPIVAHRRALRWVEKRLLRDLWRAWRRQAISGMSPSEDVPVGAADAEVSPP